MLVMQGTTVAEVRESFVHYIRTQRDRYRAEARSSRKKMDQELNIARANALENIALDLEACQLTDLRAHMERMAKNKAS